MLELLAVLGRSKGWLHPPPFRNRIQAGGIRQKMPPAHRGGRTLLHRQGAQERNGVRCGEVHQLQTNLGVTRRQIQERAQGKRFARGGIHGPAGPQRLNPLPDEALLGQTPVPWGQEHRSLIHFRQAQATLQQGKGWSLGAIGKSEGTAGELIAMGSQLVPCPRQAEAAPEQQLQSASGGGTQGLEPLGGIAPRVGVRQQGDGAVTRCNGRALQGRPGLGHPVLWILQTGMGIHQWGSQEQPRGVDLRDGGFETTLTPSTDPAVLQADVGAARRLTRSLQKLNLAQHQGLGERHGHR